MIYLKWLGLFKEKVLGDDPFIFNGKPSPEPYLLGAKKLNLKPEECWAIEDSTSGILSAIKAGCIVWVLTNNKEIVLNNLPNYPKKKLIIINNLNIILQELKTGHH